MTKRAFVTGVTGQDGSYLAELLLRKGYEVHGLVRRTSTVARTRIDHLHRPDDPSPQFFLHYGDITDALRLRDLLERIEPDEVYNLAAQSHVRVSFDEPAFTVEVTGMGAVNLLEAVRRMKKPAKFYQASSSEMFGKVAEVPQSEKTPLHPRSPYGCAKAFAYYQAINYREAYGMFACNGILFNHESPRRGESFVTRKISRAAARIKLGLQDKLSLGNLDAKRDWGFAPDYVDAMWRMLQHREPDDYVVATGETHSVGEFLEKAFTRVGLSWRDHVVLDPKFERPSEVDLLLGDASKARRVLDWEPHTLFDELVAVMVDSDLELAKKES
ncbi:MAG TPA: GDP-mannose 4,6-dehydratase [Candidatus Limnocylindrales bacterium]|nr:GDP-mannose 4,6-dehydratase [Candidatus Limnocylindrales bacterium]